MGQGRSRQRLTFAFCDQPEVRHARGGDADLAPRPAMNRRGRSFDHARDGTRSTERINNFSGLGVVHAEQLPHLCGYRKPYRTLNFAKRR